ncbi:MAG: hypothetical protein R3B72_11155 [Polyangiaceae bacterium]
MNRLALLFSLGLGFAWSCANVSLEEILDGKACDEAGNCAEGYVCNTATMICVLPGGEGGEGPSTGGGGPSTGGAGTGGVGDGGGGAQGGGGSMCPPLDAPPGGSCPGICNGGCADDTCLINCETANACGDVTCPDGFNCQVDCMVSNACRMGTITCPPGNLSCEVTCTAADNACRALTIQCASTGSCAVSCGDNVACNDVTLGCGTGACTATCDSMAAGKPTVLSCGGSCNCDQETCL